MPNEHTFLLDLPDVLEALGLNVMVAEGYEYGQGNYLWTNPHTGQGSYHEKPFGYMVHHSASSSATPPPSDTSKASAWIGLERDGRLYQEGGGTPTIYLASAGPARISSGYGYRPAAWDYTFKQLRAPARASGADGSTALNRYSFNMETVHRGNGSPIDAGVLDHVVGLGIALEQMCELEEMTLGHRSWSTRKIDPYWDNDVDCIIEVQDRVAQEEPMNDFVEVRDIVVEPKTHTTLATLVAPHDDTTIWAAYIRVPPSDATQFLTRFVRDAGHTGGDDRAVTPGKEFISRMWMFDTPQGEDVGIQLWHDAPEAITVEYVSLKRSR